MPGKSEPRRAGAKQTYRRHAEELGIPLQTAVNWIRAGMPETEPERSGWVACNRPKKDAAAAGDKAAAELRLAQLRAKKLEVELAVREGELVRLADAQQIAARKAQEIRQRILAVPHAIAEELAPEMTPAAAKRIMERALDDALAVLAGLAPTPN